MKSIYIMMSHTNTTIGKLIRFFSKYKYNHISISSNSTLQPLYSFARYHYNSPLVGGFVQESILRYLYNNQDVPIRIYNIEITESQFQKFESIMLLHSNESPKYIYNTFGLFFNNKNLCPYSQTCLSFTESVLKDIEILSSDINIKNIKDLANHLSIYPYTDTTLTIMSKISYNWGNDMYNKKVPIHKIIHDTFTHFHKLIYLHKLH